MLDEPSVKRSGRNVEVQQKYESHKKLLRRVYGGELPCPFCAEALSDRLQVDQTNTMMVVKNDFAYELFDSRLVSQHLMIVPKRHIGEFSDFSEDEKSEYWQLATIYQSRGYALFTRALGDEMRSVALHLHTHAISYQS